MCGCWEPLTREGTGRVLASVEKAQRSPETGHSPSAAHAVLMVGLSGRSLGRARELPAAGSAGLPWLQGRVLGSATEPQGLVSCT